MKQRFLALAGAIFGALLVASCGPVGSSMRIGPDSAQAPSANGVNQGIQVNGWWVIDVRQVDGGLVNHVEFENALTDNGKSFLFDLFFPDIALAVCTPGDTVWSLVVNGNESALIPATTSGDGSGALILSATAAAASLPAVITDVDSVIHFKHASTCGFGQFTHATLPSAVGVPTGGTVSFDVTLTFV